MRYARYFGVFLLAALGGFAVGCDRSAASDTTTLSVVVDSSGAVPVVTVSGEPLPWSLDTLAVIRAEPTVGFSRVRSVALDPRGGVWVADVGEQQLSYWSDAGVFVETRGRKGSGPGEFRSPYAIAVHNDGLLVFDPGNGRIERFALSAGKDSAWPSPVRMTGDPMRARFWPDPVAGPRLFDLVMGEITREGYFPVDGGGASQGPEIPAMLEDTRLCQASERFFAFSSPFSPRRIAAPYRDGTLEAVDGEYRIHRYDAAGTLVTTLERPVSRDTVLDEEYEREMGEWRAYLMAGSEADCTGGFVRYARKPAVVALLPDPDGRLWVERRMPGRTVYEVWAGDSLLAQVPAPDRESTVPPAMLGDRLAVVAESPDGGHEVRLYRVNRSAGGARVPR